MSKFEGITPSFTFIEVNLSELMASYRRETMNLTKPDVLSASVPISRLTDPQAPFLLLSSARRFRAPKEGRL